MATIAVGMAFDAIFIFRSYRLAFAIGLEPVLRITTSLVRSRRPAREAQ